MKQQRTLFTVLLATLGGLVLLGLCLVLPLMLAPVENEQSSLDTSGGEGTVYGKLVLYGPYDRKTPENGDYSHNIKQITVSNKDETYSFVHPPKKQETDPEDYINFMIEQDGKLYEDLTLDPEKLAAIIVAAGTPYVRDERVATGADAVALYESYGLAEADDPAYIELTLYNNEVFRVYVGDPTNDKTGYYVRLEGRDIIYVTITASMGELANSGAGYFVSPTVIPAPQQQYGEFFVDGFEIERELHTKTGVVTDSMAVAVRQSLTVAVAGAVPTTREETVFYNFNKASVPVAVRNALVGQEIGKELAIPDVVLETTVDSIEGEPIRVTYTYRFHCIEYRVETETQLGFSFVKSAADRDFFKSAPLYAFSPDTELAPYTTNDNAIMAMLETLSALSGDAVHSLGVSDADIEKYGLYTTIRFRFANKYKMDESDYGGSIGANDVTVNDEDYIEVTLYVGDVREDGTRLVASRYYDLIAVVPAETFDFLGYDSFTFIKPNLIACYVNLLKRLRFSFDYTDLTGDYTFDVSAVRTHLDQSGSLVYDSLPMNGKQVPYDNFNDLYYYLLWQNYEGEAALSDEEREALCENGRAVMTMTVETIDGRSIVYRFIPYSETKTLVAVTDGGDETAIFYTRTSLAKTMAANLIAIAEGRDFDRDEKYN